jgi:3-oxoacyl-[acyl-carrier-protein] synthase-3
VRPEDVDLVVGLAFLPDQIGIGNATFLCKELGLRAAAYNLETACSAPLAAFATACAQVQAGHASRVLVVVSCSYSRYIDPSDTFGWFLGDGVAAFMVGEVPEGEGLRAFAAVHTAETCGAFSYELECPSGTASPRIVIKAADSAGRQLAENQDTFVLDTTRRALERAGLGLDDISLFVCNTPTAWFARYFAALLGIDVERTVSTYPLVANTGPMLLPGNLHYAASRGRLKKGDWVLFYSVGSVASTAAAVVKWGDVALGVDPLSASPGRELGDR